MSQEVWVQIHQSAKGRHGRDPQTLTCSPQEHLTAAAGLLLPPGSGAASQAQACKGVFSAGKWHQLETDSDSQQNPLLLLSVTCTSGPTNCTCYRNKLFRQIWCTWRLRRTGTWDFFSCKAAQGLALVVTEVVLLLHLCFQRAGQESKRSQTLFSPRATGIELLWPRNGPICNPLL